MLITFFAVASSALIMSVWLRTENKPHARNGGRQ